jgi:hypothetical protein
MAAAGIIGPPLRCGTGTARPPEPICMTATGGGVPPVFGMKALAHRWALLLKQQTSITVNRLPTKINKLPFSASRLQKTNGNLPFHPYI